MALTAFVVRCEDSAESHRLMSPSPSPSPSPPPPPYSLCNAFSPRASAPRRLFSAGPCNYSIGDILGAVRLLRELIDALQDSGGTSEEQKELIAELRSLESAIIQVEAHYVEIDSPAQRMALDQAAQACQMLIKEFLLSLRQSQRQREASSDSTEHTGSDQHPNTKWNLATTEDIVTFRCRISAHVQSIQTLIVTIQVSSTERDHRHDDIGLDDSSRNGLRSGTNHSLVLINDSFETLRQALVDQGPISQQTLANVDAVSQMMIMNNVQLLSALEQLQDSLPPQVLLQKPVIFTDALNRIAPIHLDWIDSWDAFLAVLELRFIHLGYNKIKRREFALQETASRKDLPFTKPISACLAPGQHIDMTMIFGDQSGERSSNTCPHCHARCEGSTDSEMTCTHCGCQFRRIQQQDDQAEAIRDAMGIHAIVEQMTAQMPKKRSRPIGHIPDATVGPIDFKRLRLICSWPSRKKRRIATPGQLKRQEDTLLAISEKEEKIMQEFSAARYSARTLKRIMKKRRDSEKNGRLATQNARLTSANLTSAPSEDSSSSRGAVASHATSELVGMQQDITRRRSSGTVIHPILSKKPIVEISMTSSKLGAMGLSNGDRRNSLTSEIIDREIEDEASMSEISSRKGGIRESADDESESSDIDDETAWSGYKRISQSSGLGRSRPSQCDAVLIGQLSPNRAEIAAHAGEYAWGFMQQEGELLLETECMSRSGHEYDTFLLSKIGRWQDETTQPRGVDRMYWDTEDLRSQQLPMSVPNLHHRGVPPPLRQRRHIDDLLTDVDLRCQLRDLNEDFGPRGALAPIQPTTRPPIGDGYESREVRRETSNDLPETPSQWRMPAHLDFSMLHGLPYQSNYTQASPTSPTGLFLTSRIETSALNSSSGWINPGQTATAWNDYDTIYSYFSD